MNPLQKNKIDVKSLSPEEQRLFRLYGKLPTRTEHFAKHFKERKYFDSGDYAMSKAGKGDGVDAGAVGSQHPVPENIPHLSSPVSNNGGAGGTNAVPKHLSLAAAANAVPQGLQAGSPVKESSFLNRETSANEIEEERPAQDSGPSTETLAAGGAGIPIRR